MANDKKKTPKTTLRRKVTASARAHVSTTKRKQTRSAQQEGSFLQQLNNDTVSNGIASSSNAPGTSTQTHTVTSPNQEMLDLLRGLSESNKSLTARMDKMEENILNPPTSNIRFQDHERHSITATLGSTNNADYQLPQQPLHSSPQRAGYQAVPPIDRTQRERPLNTIDHPSLSDARNDAIAPNIEVLRRIPSVSEAVNKVLATYEAQLHSDLIQGKNTTKKSGRFNTVDIVTAPAHLRWPNEGFQGVQGRKRLSYHDLSLPQWVSGQLSNIYHIQDPSTVKQALFQMILATKDAASLPWPTVRDAWAVSMHAVQEGRLGWEDTNQWSFNRLGASQIPLSNRQPTPQANRKICRYYNEGSCSHENHHGSYSHFCSFCMKQGRHLSHPESKCNFKVRGQVKMNSNYQQTALPGRQPPYELKNYGLYLSKLNELSTVSMNSNIYGSSYLKDSQLHSGIDHYSNDFQSYIAVNHVFSEQSVNLGHDADWPVAEGRVSTPIPVLVVLGL